MLKWTPEKITALRKAYGESQGTFCERVGVRVDGYRLWEQGRGFPNGSAQLLLDRLKEDLDRGDIRDLETGKSIPQPA